MNQNQYNLNVTMKDLEKTKKRKLVVTTIIEKRSEKTKTIKLNLACDSSIED